MRGDAVTPALQMTGICKGFPGVRALADVSLTLMPGQVHALMGENGAGKSTLIKILAGVYQPDAGSIRVEGAEVAMTTPREARAWGIKVVFQEIALIPEFTVAENVYLGEHPVGPGGSIRWRQIAEEARALFDRVGFAVDPQARVRDLPLSQQQMVEIARAIAHNARIVVMDEPTSSLTPNEVAQLFAVIRRLTGMGIAVLYVSHKIDEIFEIADTVTVLRDGAHVSTRAKTEHTEDSLIRDMIGRTLDTMYPRTRAHQGGAVLLEVKGLSAPSGLRDISFTAKAGEVVGFFGLMGAGRTELAKAIVGFDPISAGTVTLGGAALRPHTTATGVGLGIGLLSEDRKSEGLMLDLPVVQNATLAALPRFARGLFLNQRGERDETQGFVDRFRIRTPGLDQPVKLLSGGNQQKVLIARWLMRGLRVIVMDEPTRGIDVGAKSEIFALIDELAGQGLAVVMMTSEMPELLGLSDRIHVMAGGRITGTFDRAQATQEGVLNAAIL